MGDVLCETHGLVCSMKTGSSEGSPNFGKTFFLCPLYPKECSFMQPSSIPPQFCKYHGKNMIDLKIFKVLPTGETIEYSRCKESRSTLRKFCDRQIIKNKLTSLPCNNMTSMEKLQISSASKETKELCYALSKPERQIDTSSPQSSEQQSRQNSIIYKPMLHSLDGESDLNDDYKKYNRHTDDPKKINQKQEKHKVTIGENALKKSTRLTVHNEQERNNLKKTRDKKKATFLSDNNMTSKDRLHISSADKEETKELCYVINKSERPINTFSLQSFPKKQNATVPCEQQATESFVTTNINNSFREPVLIHSSDEESNSDDDQKMHNRNIDIIRKTKQKQEHKVAVDENALRESMGLITTNEQDRNHLKQTLDKKKKIYNTADVSKLPDKGARLKNEIESLELMLNKLQLIGDNHTAKSHSSDSEKLPKDTVIDSSAKDREESMSSTSTNNKAPFSQNPSSFETFRDLKMKNEMTSSSSVNKTVGNKAILISPLPVSSASFEKYRSNTASNDFMTSTDEGKKKISDAMIALQKSLKSFPDETQQEDIPAVLKTSLLPHQHYALKWLLWRESHFPYGGILADDMGLGKSLTMVSLILKHKENLKKKLYSTERKSDNEKLHHNEPTLIICPASLVHHWKNEILNHCKVGSVETCIYHGPNRIRDSEKLQKYDVVITTYETVRADVEPDLKHRKGKVDSHKDSKQRSCLLSVLWERIVLDEAHKVKNPASLVSKCLYLLTAKFRWAITGTPIHNNLMDLYSLIKFLCFSPFDDLMLWKKYILGMDNLMKTLVKCLLLRRTKDQTDKKGKCLVQLPAKEIQVVSLKLTNKERDVYDKLQAFYQSRMKTFLEEKEDKSNRSSLENVKRRSNETNVKVNASFLLVILLRLQQCCCHLALLQKVVEDEILPKDNEEKDLTQQLSLLSLNNSNSNSSTESSLNTIDTSSSSITSCSTVKDNSLKFDLLELSSYIDAADLKTEAISTKVSSVLEELAKIRNQAKDGRMEKCVLVSQWVSFLEIMAVHIKSKGFCFSMISGSIKAEERMSIVDDFNQLNGKEILLLSLKAGGVGLNLVGGNHLFLLDTHWNPALENQACDRIYRLGQTKNVFIHKFICTDTIEERIVKLQKEKLGLAKNVLEGEHSKHILTMKDMKELFSF